MPMNTKTTDRHIVAYTDGSALRHWLGYSVVCYYDDRVRILGRHSKPGTVTHGTFCVAELLAVNLLLNSVASRKRGNVHLTIVMDSQTVVNALQGRQSPRDLRDHLEKTKCLLTEYKSHIVIWEKRDKSPGNRLAHQAANDARWRQKVDQVRAVTDEERECLSYHKSPSTS